MDLKFGIDVGVDYYALSFVRNADVIYELKRYLAKQGAQRPASSATATVGALQRLGAVMSSRAPDAVRQMEEST